MSKKIGIIGGTFSPIHKAHLHLAKESLEHYGLDEVWFVVAGLPPHKNVEGNVNPFLRLEMCKLATKDEPRFVVKDFECQSLNVSYTAKTMERLRRDHPDYDFYFIMGEDSLDNFKSWKDPEIIAKDISFLISVRSELYEKDASEFDKKVKDFEKAYNTHCHIINSNYIPVSSTMLREALRNKDASIFDKYIPKEVQRYIFEHRIYDVIPDYDLISMDGLVKTTQKPKRYDHCIKVADTAANLAANYLFPIKTAYATGILHDCAKHFSGEELINYCKEHDLPITDAEYESPYLLHGIVGGHIAKEKFGIDDEMVHAISVHTRGCEDMSLLDKIIFLADHIEPGRARNKKLDEIRYMAYKNIDNAVIMILEDTVDYLKTDGRPIDSQTMDTLNYYRKGML